MPRRLKHPWLTTCLVVSAFLATLAWAEDTPSALYWAIDSDQGRVGYLLGTIHSEDPRVLDFTAGFLEEVASCQVFAMELVPDQVTLSRLAAFMHLPEGHSLEQVIGQERFEAVRQALSVYGMPPGQVARLKPWAAMMTLSVPPPETGLFMDFALSLRADGMGMRVVGLETLEQQLSFLESMSDTQQIELLEQALGEFDSVRAVHDAMVDTYLEGDVGALQSMTREQMETLDPVTREWFLAEGIDARNHRMRDALMPLLRTQSVFTAVGALHLPGETGLVRLLEAEGYTLKPLPLPLESR